jgi:uncharacterized protein (DUF1684 family)
MRCGSVSFLARKYFVAAQKSASSRSQQPNAYRSSISLTHHPSVATVQTRHRCPTLPSNQSTRHCRRFGTHAAPPPTESGQAKDSKSHLVLHSCHFWCARHARAHRRGDEYGCRRIAPTVRHLDQRIRSHPIDQTALTVLGGLPSHMVDTTLVANSST